jgi:hypothetical protein
VDRDNITFKAGTDAGYYQKLTTNKTQAGNLSDDILPIFDNAKAKSAAEKKKT